MMILWYIVPLAILVLLVSLYVVARLYRAACRAVADVPFRAGLTVGLWGFIGTLLFAYGRALLFSVYRPLVLPGSEWFLNQARVREGELVPVFQYFAVLGLLTYFFCDVTRRFALRRNG